jgi:phosphohistidine phosphatase SixA
MFKKIGLALGLLVSMAMATPALADHTVYLLRHAEKVSGQYDGDLTGNGKRRAANIAAMLKDAGVERIYSTDFKRTQQTAAPLAAAVNLAVQSYNPFDMPSFAETLKAHNGVSVVVGHSNTTPDLIWMLGGDAGSAISEAEYSRLYQVTIADDGTVKTVLLHSVAE